MQNPGNLCKYVFFYVLKYQNYLFDKLNANRLQYMNNQSTINFNINENFKFNITLSRCIKLYYYIFIVKIILITYFKNNIFKKDLLRYDKW